MAKQTFTTGQVLTAAQMTSLQQTAMGGGSATAKVASYVLVGADAGTTVAMDAAGATTITVNTALFAAGDTVFIQNLGAGACTVTAGTATVATAGSLILPQNDAGILYFTATGASIFYDYIQAGAVSPLTTKGDLYTFSTSDARLAVGTNTYTLVADSAEATGLKWAAPAGGGMTLLSTTTLSGTSTNVSITPTGYIALGISIEGIDLSGSGDGVSISINNAANSYLSIVRSEGASASVAAINNTYIPFNNGTDMDSSANNAGWLNIYNPTSSTNYKPLDFRSYWVSSTAALAAYFGGGAFKDNTAVSSIMFDQFAATTFTAGTVKVYGVK